MIETISFFVGLSFSVLVYILAIRPADLRALPKLIYALISAVGITGMVWLCGVIIAHFLRKWNILP